LTLEEVEPGAFVGDGRRPEKEGREKTHRAAGGARGRRTQGQRRERALGRGGGAGSAAGRDAEGHRLVLFFVAGAWGE
jgi:hypothetical protein